MMRFRGVFRSLMSENGAFCENREQLKAVTYFYKNLQLRCLTGF